ncbi:MAG: glycoside hydrolase family 3 N-terminal domain-containing protein [Ferruginibacter sp.]|nr:serine hydrolase [Chitinophagaceae bacterium]
MRKIQLILFLFLAVNGFAQQKNKANIWVDSVFKTLSPDEQIAQLMVVRLSTINANKSVTFYDSLVTELIKQYNIGSLCVFQGSPVKQATILNQLQALAKTPLLVTIDAEWGVGMRMTDSVLPLPRQMMLGAVQDSSIAYQYGRIVAEQCRRIGIQVNFAPVVDVNNNPNNPVINDRSFGEDKYKVASYGIQYMKGMQDNGVMACAKHFPGHGDVSVDSHYDLPVINKTRPQLESLELFPFREIFKAGVGSVMIAHLYIPSIDTSANRATSLSKNNVTDLLRNQLGYQGLTFTDALEMQGVKKFFADGAASVESIIAGNDMLCLPGDVPLAIAKIKEAITAGKISWADIEMHCRKVLKAKFDYGLSNLKPINTNNITNDLNKDVSSMRKLIAENALTVLKKTDAVYFPLPANKDAAKKEMLYVSIGTSSDNAFASRMRADYNADVTWFDYKKDDSDITTIVSRAKKDYKHVVIGVHGYGRSPANNFGISKNAIDLVTQLQQKTKAITFVFGNVYAVKNWCNAPNLVACYEDDSIIHNTAIDLLQGKIAAQGKLPVTVCDQLKFGTGITFKAPNPVKGEKGMLDAAKLNSIDAIAEDAIAQGATPGAVVLVAKDGKIVYHKAYGNYTYDKTEAVNTESIFDMASVTKVCATTIAVMRLYDEGKLDLKKKLGDYLSWVKGTNKENLTIENILLHQAGLVSYIPFFKETIDSAGVPKPALYSTVKNDSFGIRVANNMYMRNDWRDTIYKRILESPLGRTGRYIYSDNDFIFLGKIVEAISGQPLNEYVETIFYRPMGLTTTGFKPREQYNLQRIIPTEQEKQFRLQLLRGDVHDPGAAMFGGVAGHAGLFSNAYDLAMIMQMLLNGGTINGKRYLQEETVNLFAAYQSDISRRGYGFDKPEKNNRTRPDPYPSLSASPQTFGHTGYTGTCVWADPKYDMLFIFLSNRVNPIGGENTKLLRMNVRTNIQEAVYKAMGL